LNGVRSLKLDAKLDGRTGGKPTAVVTDIFETGELTHLEVVESVGRGRRRLSPMGREKDAAEDAR
jgi:hypothetical protein